MAEKQLVLAHEAMTLRWLPWDDRNKVPTRSHRSKFVTEMELLGVFPDELGTWDTRPVDGNGRITGTNPVNWLIDECVWLLKPMRRYLTRPGFIDPPVGERLDEIEHALRSGNTNLSFWEDYMEMLTLLNVVLGDEPELMAEIHEWLVDPFLFQSDCCGVFPSEAEDVDVLVLTCEEGYAFVAKKDMDRLFHFRGETAKGRPRFGCSDASNAKRKTLTKRPVGRQDKIQDIERLRGLAVKNNRKNNKEEKENGTDS